MVTEKSQGFNITNETGTEERTSFLKNIIGLWLIQESRRQWIREGREYSFSELEEMAKEAGPLKRFIAPDAPELVPAGNVPGRIRAYCERTGQRAPETVGEMVRCINESLALKYRYAMEEIKECTGKDYRAVHMVGGGIRSKLLCTFTAHACGLPVIADPLEATVYGNIAIQFMAKGILTDLKEARQVIAASEAPVTYWPENHEDWNTAYEFYKKNIQSSEIKGVYAESVRTVPHSLVFFVYNS